MKLKKARPVDREAFNRSSLISRADAVRLIAQEVGEPRTNVSHRVRYAIDTGKLEKAAQGQFVFGRLVAWAQDTWPGHFSGWPATRTVGGSLTLRWDVGDVPIGGKPPPTTLAGWREIAYALDRENAKLRGEIDSLRRKLASAHGKLPRQ
jgi:hypothetical protein